MNRDGIILNAFLSELDELEKEAMRLPTRKEVGAGVLAGLTGFLGGTSAGPSAQHAAANIFFKGTKPAATARVEPRAKAAPAAKAPVEAKAPAAVKAAPTVKSEGEPTPVRPKFAREEREERALEAVKPKLKEHGLERHEGKSVITDHEFKQFIAGLHPSSATKPEVRHQIQRLNEAINDISAYRRDQFSGNPDIKIEPRQRKEDVNKMMRQRRLLEERLSEVPRSGSHEPFERSSRESDQYGRRGPRTWEKAEEIAGPNAPQATKDVVRRMIARREIEQDPRFKNATPEEKEKELKWELSSR